MTRRPAATWSRPALAAFAVLIAAPLACERSGPLPATTTAPAAEAFPRRPWNILLVSLCSVRADHLSVYGYARTTSPSYEKLAAESWVFDKAITQWPKTTPAFAAILSARYGHETGVMRVVPKQHLDEQVVTLADVLGSAGYDTAAFVSTAAVCGESNLLQGFALREEVWRDAHTRHSAPTDRALAWLKQRTGAQRPFLLWAHYNNAHYPYDGGGADPEMFVDDAQYDRTQQVRVQSDRRMRLRLPLPRDYPNLQQILRPDMGMVHYGAILPARPTELAYYHAVYDAGIFGGDQQVGRLLDGVGELGLLENTIVALVGDHGESLGEQNFYAEHGRLPYESTAWVPLMIRPPGGRAETRIAPPVATFSLAPTLLDMVGVQPPAEWTARSLLPALEGRESPPPYVFTESGYHPDYTLAVRDATHKLIWVPNRIDQQLQRGVEYELYDYRADPGETTNLFTIATAAAATLRGVLDAWAAPWIQAAHGRVYEFALAPDPARIAELTRLGYLGGAEEEEGDATAQAAAPATTPAATQPDSQPAATQPDSRPAGDSTTAPAAPPRGLGEP